MEQQYLHVGSPNSALIAERSNNRRYIGRKRRPTLTLVSVENQRGGGGDGAR